MAHGAVIDLLQHLRHQGIGTAQTLGVHKGPERRVIFVLIGIVQQSREHRFPKLPAFIFVSHPEIRSQIQLIGILPQQIGAKTVNCGDFRQKQPLHLLLQMAVFRIFCDPFRQLGGNFTPKLGSCRFGIGNDEKLVQIGRVNRVRQVEHQTVHQDFCLAGTGSGTDQQRSAPVFHRLFLLGRQLIRHGAPPFRFLPRTAGRS